MPRWTSPAPGRSNSSSRDMPLLPRSAGRRWHVQSKAALLCPHALAPHSPIRGESGSRLFSRLSHSSLPAARVAMRDGHGPAHSTNSKISRGLPSGVPVPTHELPATPTAGCFCRNSEDADDSRSSVRAAEGGPLSATCSDGSVGWDRWEATEKRFGLCIGRLNVRAQKNTG